MQEESKKTERKKERESEYILLIIFSPGYSFTSVAKRYCAN